MSKASKPAEYPILSFRDQTAWTVWLDDHHASERGIWMRIAKLASGLASVTFPEALDGALCYGWIDGQRKRYDDDTYLQKFTPRGKRSTWSKRNREHVERLVASGAMQAPGLAAVQAAKADGRWDRAYDPPGSATVPDDFKAALEEHPAAMAFFETLKSADRFAMISRIQTAVKPETRARRITEFVARLRRGPPFQRP